MHTTPYTDRIAKLSPGYDPRHVEAFMRSELSTLDRLDPLRFWQEVEIAKATVE